jgi:hypothetical protein
MRRVFFLTSCAAICLAVPACADRARADDDRAVAALTQDLKEHVPSQWEVRVRWRDGQLLATITPWPYQEAFQLWYEPGKLAETLTGLCPGPGSAIWSLIGSDQDVILEPTVGGKSALEARVSCRKTRA